MVNRDPDLAFLDSYRFVGYNPPAWIRLTSLDYHVTPPELIEKHQWSTAAQLIKVTIPYRGRTGKRPKVEVYTSMTTAIAAHGRAVRGSLDANRPCKGL